MKLLVLGKVTAFGAAILRLEKLQASAAGPFDLCLVSCLSDTAGLAAWLSAGKVAPLLTAFTCANLDEGASKLIEENSEKCKLLYLKGAGDQRISGARVVFDDGSSAEEFDALLTKLKGEMADRPHVLTSVVDIVITPTLPYGVFSLLSSPPAAGLAAGAAEAAATVRTKALVEAAEPRYHFCDGEQYYQRPPYANSNSGVCTRLVAIAEFSQSSDGKAERKNIHALNLTPATDLDIATLTEFPDGSTQSPFTAKPAPTEGILQAVKVAPAPSAAARGVSSAAIRAAQAALGGAGVVRPRDNALPDDGYGAKRPRREERPHLTEEQVARLHAEGSKGSQYFWNVRQNDRGRTDGRKGGRDAPECWFCLASPHVEKHLVVSVGTETYLALPKGGINPYHVLVVPVQHHHALSVAPKGVRDEAQAFLTALGRFFHSKGMGLIAFERVLRARRGDIPVHTHLQVIGVPSNIAITAASTFITEGKFRHMAFETLAPDVDLQSALGESEADAFDTIGASLSEYFYVEVPTGEPPASDAERPPFTKLLHRIPEGAKHPVQFGREVLCRILGSPDRLQWKDCALGTAAETRQATEIRAEFAPFDFTLAL